MNGVIKYVGNRVQLHVGVILHSMVCMYIPIEFFSFYLFDLQLEQISGLCTLQTFYIVDAEVYLFEIYGWRVLFEAINNYYY